MKKVFRTIKNWSSQLALAQKIALMCLIIFVVSVSLTTLLNQRFYQNISVDQSNATLRQTIDLVENNVDTSILQVSNAAKAIISNKSARAIMKLDAFTLDMDTHYQVVDFTRNLLDNTFYSSSVHLFNTNQKNMDIGIGMVNYPVSSDITTADWYEKVEELNGQIMFIDDTDGFFPKNDTYSYITMACIFNDIETQKSHGVLCINFTKDVITRSYENLVQKYNIDIVIVDEYGNDLVDSQNNFDLINIKKEIDESDNGYVFVEGEEDEYMVSYTMNSNGWTIFGFMDTKSIRSDLNRFSLISLTLIIITGFLMFMGVIVVMQRETKSLTDLVHMMSESNPDKLEPTDITPRNKDIALLKDGYNKMVDEINTLIDRIIDEQETKSNLQFIALQSQVKPHFLYNTFDTISSLALMGDNQLVYETLLALGSFYRVSLSKGSEVITLEEEINLIKNYAKILMIRYDDVFSIEYDVGDTLLNTNIPKLTLQPLVENAIYHGIRSQGQTGVIKISCKDLGDRAEIIIEDDGIGMSQELINKVMNDDRSTKSFGIKATKERLDLYYKCSDVLKIESEVGVGTKIIICVPLLGE